MKNLKYNIINGVLTLFNAKNGYSVKEIMTKEPKYHISDWDTKNMTDMCYMFAGMKDFNEDISCWNTRNVTNMSGMFHGATSYNQDISNWDIDNVELIIYMFSKSPY